MSLPEISAQLCADEQAKHAQSQTYRQMFADREQLPVYQYRQQILDMISKNRVCLIKGETGCGKTTQVRG